MPIMFTDEALGSRVLLSDIEAYMNANYKHGVDARSAMARLNRQWVYDRFLWWTRNRETIIKSEVLSYEFVRHLERMCGGETIAGGVI